MSKHFAILLTIFCSSACVANGGQKSEPAQCFVLDESPGGPVSGALKRISGSLGLEIELSIPNYLLLKDHAGAPRILLAYAPRDIGTLLVSYRGVSRDFIDLRKLKELNELGATSKPCPATGKNFSPPTFFD